MLQIALLIFGIVILAKRKVAISKKRVVTGGPAIAIGSIFVGVMPFGFVVGFILGAVFAASGNQELVMKYAPGLDMALIVLAIVLAFIIAQVYGRPAGETAVPTVPPIQPSYAPPEDPSNPYNAPRRQ